jgi:hypothetical protein
MRQNGKKQSVELSLLHKKVGNVNVDQHWEYPGRDVDWLCTWQPCLKLYVLTILKELMSRTKEQRYESLQAIWDNSRIIDDLNDIAVLVKQTQYTSIDEVQAYDQAIISGYEGLVMMHKNSSYKMGRHSLNSGIQNQRRQPSI